MNRITLTITSKWENVRIAALCAKEIAHQAFDEAALVEIEVAVVETVNNCIEHAYAGSDEHQVTIRYLLADDQLVIEIIDDGKVMAKNFLDNLHTDFDFDPTDFDNLPEGGMGLKLVKNCMDEVCYQHNGEHNLWVLTKYRRVNEA